MKKLYLLILVVISLDSCNSQDRPSLPSSVSENVSIIDHSFTIHGLDREREIWIYLPEDYDESSELYPVLYMHDGQNLFDDSTSYAGEWEVDESLNQLAEESGFKLIVVGINHGGEKRMNELSPWMNLRHGKGEGKEYMEFIVQSVKPFIDSTYRTKSGKEYTGIMGSSMGGLISHYAIYKYPEVFSKAGIFSPSYWYNNDVYTFTEEHTLPSDHRLFMLIGEKEGDMVPMAENMYKTIIKDGHPKNTCKLIVDPDGEHGEAFWKKHFTESIRWLYEIE